MSNVIACFRCGESLAALSLPLSQRDRCPQCSADLCVCKMCRHFDANAARQCREDGADDVKEKERPNFCDWFIPTANAFDVDRRSAAVAAEMALKALFSKADGD